jgi:hypothetical protein
VPSTSKFSSPTKNTSSLKITAGNKAVISSKAPPQSNNNKMVGEKISGLQKKKL